LHRASAVRLWQVAAGRVITGLGVAGMLALVSPVIITGENSSILRWCQHLLTRSDKLPPSEVALMRSYVNVVNVTGRAFRGQLAD
jgi:hypothetical protein